jgi:hypothetical protein
MKTWPELIMHVPFVAGILVGMGMLIILGLLSFLAFIWGFDE